MFYQFKGWLSRSIQKSFLFPNTQYICLLDCGAGPIMKSNQDYGYGVFLCQHAINIAVWRLESVANLLAV